jgi:2-octaprenyl-6-methoxyphenol hydroxylase
MAALDVAIVGAGPVGATVAALCAGAQLDIALFEARSVPPRDARILALSHASRELLEDAGAWPVDSTPITSIHVSQKGGPGRTLITAADQGLAALGHTLSYGTLQAALEERLQELAIPVHYGHSCEGIEVGEEHASLSFGNGQRATARLLVLADGGANAVKIPGIAFSEKDYAQSAVLGALHSDRPHGGRAYERFTRHGPIALLPVADRYALVWTVDPDEATRVLALEERAFLAELQEAFGDRAGRFVHVSNRACFSLKLRAVNSRIALRTAIVGNAAQALHPIAGQGLNLGLRDAAALASLLASGNRSTIGDAAMLQDYREARRRDTSRGIAFTDMLVSAFADARRLPTWGRGLGLAVLDLFPPARRIVAERMIRGAGP